MFDFDDDLFLLNESFDTDDDMLLLEADEPMEDDADMDSDGDMGEGDTGSEDDDIGGDDMEMDEEGEEGETSEDSSDDIGGEEETQLTPIEATKKKRLFADYRKLLFNMEKAMETSDKIDYYSMSEDGKKIFNHLERKINENHDKLLIIMTEQYSKLPYSQLLTMYLYMKIVLKSYTEILLTLFEKTVE